MTRARLTDALMIGAVTIMTTLSGDALGAEDTSATLTPAALAEIARVEAEIDRIEAQTLERLAAPPDNQVQQIELLGKLMLYDKHLSVNRNEACAFCHTRETGRRLGNPAAEQAEGPPTNPVEMGLPDIACAVYRASQRRYRALFEKVWGQQAFAIEWPSDVEQVCDQPGPPPA